MNRRLLSLLCTTACAQQVFVSVGITVRGHGPVVFVVDAHEKISVLPVHLARSMCERATLDDAACAQLVGSANTLVMILAERQYIAAAGGLAAHDVRVEYVVNDEACEVGGNARARAARATELAARATELADDESQRALERESARARARGPGADARHAHAARRSSCST